VEDDKDNPDDEIAKAFNTMVFNSKDDDDDSAGAFFTSFGEIDAGAA